MKLFLAFILLLYILPSNAQSQLPAAKRISVKPAQVFDVTQARKKPENLFDGDTTTPGLQDYFNGFILSQTKGQVAWVVLDDVGAGVGVAEDDGADVNGNFRVAAEEV